MISFILAIVVSFSVFGWSACPGASYFPFNMGNKCFSSKSECEAMECPSETTHSSYPQAVFTGGYKSGGCTTGSGCWSGAIASCIYTGCYLDTLGACTDLKRQCEEAGGIFNGTTVSDNGQNCCRGSCNVCGSNAMKSMYEAKFKICCENGLAPPDANQTCSTVQMPTSGCGMVWSSYGDFTSGGWSCSDPSSSWEAGSRYSQCFAPKSSSGGNSSSGATSSGSSSGNGDYGDCKECPWLDSILDTLTAQKRIISSIYDCITSPFLCSTAQNDSLPGWVREKLDDIIDIDSAHKNISDSIKSIMKRILVTDSALLSSDTLTRLAIANVALSVDSSVSVASDSVTAWIHLVVDSLHITKRQMINHLDSIRSAIPNDILDSIIKYQKTALDDFDSAFYGSNSGFKKIDNLIDSAVKYFQEGFRHDSIYYANYGDSLGAIHSAISDIGSNIGYGLGYGDTSSTTLRKDLNGIKVALDDLNGKFDVDVVDTSAVGFASSWVADGERMGDSIGRAVGWIGGLDGVNVDSVFAAGSWGESGVDSISDFLNDTLGGIVDSLHLLLQNENDSLKNSLSDSLTVWADSMIKVSPFVVFDSLIYSTIGAKIPNSDQCPEDCQSWTLSLPRFGLINYTVDFGLCLGRVPLGGLNVLGFLRLIIRLVIVWSCISIVMWTFSHRKM